MDVSRNAEPDGRSKAHKSAISNLFGTLWELDNPLWG